MGFANLADKLQSNKIMYKSFNFFSLRTIRVVEALEEMTTTLNIEQTSREN